MPSYFVVQPNGLLGRFSTVVDDFTAMNMSESEAAELISDEYSERAAHDAEQAITRAKELSKSRWPDCLSTIRSIHGENTVAERLRFLDAPEPVPSCPPLSGVSDAPGRWDQFTEEELCTFVGALKDSGGMRSDYGWHLRCSRLHVELVAMVLAKLRGSVPQSQPTEPKPGTGSQEKD